MAMASAKAIPISIAGKIFAEASGFLPIASIALNPISPIAKAGNIPPIAITAPLAKTISKIVTFLSITYVILSSEFDEERRI